jgi:hypothetical protein
MDGIGVRKILRTKCPEELIWEHFNFIRKNHKFMVNRESQRMLMSFDDKSRAKTFDKFPEVEIENYLDRFKAGKYEYKGLTRSQLRGLDNARNSEGDLTDRT